ncbi:MAG TPA: FAD-dependent oxidoreductase, partial [Clostridia bacterium]
KQYGASVNFEEVIKIDLKNDIKTITTDSNTYQAKAVILAMGTNNRKLGLPEEENLVGKGISYCATCDGAFFKGREVAIAGGANSAVTEALYLSKLASKVHIIYRRDKFRGESISINKLLSTPNIILHLNSEITRLISDDVLTGVEIKDKLSNQTSVINVNGLFVAIGQIPNTDLIKDQVLTDEKGYIITDDNMAVNIQGVYAAGDIRANTFRQVVTACGDGARAANSVIDFIHSKF